MFFGGHSVAVPDAVKSYMNINSLMNFMNTWTQKLVGLFPNSSTPTGACWALITTIAKESLNIRRRC